MTVESLSPLSAKQNHDCLATEAFFWHPVGLSTDFLPEKSVAICLLNQELVIWRDSKFNLSAMPDQCPHRGAKLSLGQVVNDQLTCAYHGWRFQNSGQCSQIPALPEFTPSPKHCVKTYPVEEKYGLVWVQLKSDFSTTANSEILKTSHLLPQFLAASDSHLRSVVCGPYTVQSSAPRLVENFLDMAHFSFVHEGYLGDAQLPQVANYTVERSATSIKATACKAWQPQSNAHSTQSALIEYEYYLDHPYSAVLTKIPPDGASAKNNYRESIALWICPVTPTECKVWFTLAVADFETEDAIFQQFQDTIFLQDQPILESQRPALLPVYQDTELHCAADKTSAMYRRLLKDWGISFGVC